MPLLILGIYLGIGFPVFALILASLRAAKDDDLERGLSDRAYSGD